MNNQPQLYTLGAGMVPVSADDDNFSEADGGIDIAALLRQIWSAAYRNWLLVISIIGICVLFGILATMLATPQYLATASIQIDQASSRILGTEDVDTASISQDADRFLQTQIDVLKSHLVAEQVANSLNLASNDNFLTSMHVKPALDRHGQVLNALEINLKVDLPRTSRVVDISFKSPDPNVAQVVANSFASNFIMLNIKRKFDQTAYARSFLQDQLVSAKQRLEDSERAMLAYSRAVGLIDASAGIGTSDTGGGGGTASGPRSLVTSDLVSLNNAYAAAQANRLAAEQHWIAVEHTPIFSVPEVLSNQTYIQLTQARAQAQAAYDQESQRHRADFPSLQQLGAQIVSLDRQITSITNSVRDSIHTQYDIAFKQENALAGQVDHLKAETLSEQDKSVRYNILKRETDTNRTMYDALLQRYKELSAQAGISANNISLVDNADRPGSPISPRLSINLAISILFGLMLASAIVFIREKFDDAVRSPEDVSRKLGLPLLNIVPMLKTGEIPRDALDSPRSALSESYAALRTSLELVNAGGLPGVILVTSSGSGEGKSTTAYAIARDFARIGKTVALIDSDMRRPALHRLLDLINAKGFASVLARQHPLDDVLQSTDTPNLCFISAGPHPPNPAELLAGDSLKATIAELRKRFDLVVIDSPPVLGLADTVTLASQAEGIVFVTEANAPHRGQAKSALRRLRIANATILGAVLTKYDARKVGYGYNYGYYAYNYGPDSND